MRVRAERFHEDERDERDEREPDLPFEIVEGSDLECTCCDARDVRVVSRIVLDAGDDEDDEEWIGLCSMCVAKMAAAFVAVGAGGALQKLRGLTFEGALRALTDMGGQERRSEPEGRWRRRGRD